MPRDALHGVRWSALVLVVFLVAPAVGGAAVGHPERTAREAFASTVHPDRPAVAPAVTEQRGDVVELSIDVRGSNVSTVELFRHGGAGYWATLTVRDVDGDDAVALRVNTYTAGHGDAYSAAGADEVRVEREKSVRGPIGTGTYNVTVRNDKWVYQRTSFELVERPAPELRVRAALGKRELANVSSAAAVRQAIADGTLPRHDEVSTRDVLVVELRVPGLEGPLAAADGADVTARFRTLVRRKGFGYRLREDPATVTTSDQPRRLFLNGSGARVVPDAANDTYYLVYDLDRATLRSVDGTRLRTDDRFDRGDRFDVRFELGPGSGLVDRRQQVRHAGIEVVEHGAEPVPAGTEPVLLVAGDDQPVRTSTTLPPDTTVTVWANASDGPFSQRRVVNVSRGVAGRTYLNATYDLSGVEPGTNLTLSYLVDGRQVATVEARVPQVNPAVTITAVYPNGSALANVTTPVGGVVALHRSGHGGAVVATSRYLSPGRHENVTLAPVGDRGVPDRVVAVLHRDGDRDEQFDRPGGADGRYGDDPPLLFGGERVTDAATVPPQPTPTPTTGTPTTAATASPSTSDGASTSRSTPAGTTTTSPGLALLAAVVALVAAAAGVAGRR